MFELTDTAREELDAYFEGKDKSPIRVYLAPGGCSGPRPALSLDAPHSADKVFDENGSSFCLNDALFRAAKTFMIYFSHIGFSL